MKLFVALAPLFFVSISQASTLNCFTKFYGKDSLNIQAEVINEMTLTQTTAKTSQYGIEVLNAGDVAGRVIQRGKSAGQISFDLGTVKDGAEYFTWKLQTPEGLKENSKFKATLVLGTGQGVSYYSLLCNIR